MKTLAVSNYKGFDSLLVATITPSIIYGTLFPKSNSNDIYVLIMEIRWCAGHLKISNITLCQQ